MKKIAKILSVVLCMVMVLGLMATTTFAASEDTAGLVVNFSSLKAGDKVIIASPSANVAIATTNSNNNRKTVSVSITNNVVTLGSNVQIMELVAGSQANTFRFKAVNGEYAGKILYASSSSSNNLKWGSQPDKHSDFSITINESGKATIKAMGGASRCYMTCNPNNGTPLISCYDSDKYDSLAIYKVGADAENAGVVEIPKMTIAEAKVAAADTEVEITGTVTMVSGKNVYVADAENANGILVYLKSNSDLKVGDTVTVVGKTTTYGGAPELTNATYTKGTAATLTAKTVTLPVTKDHVGTYVTIAGLKVTAIETDSKNSTHVTVTDGTNTIEIYKAVLGDLELAVGDTITYTGTVGYYNAVQLQHTTATEIEITEKAQVTPPAGGEGGEGGEGGDVTPPAGDNDDDKDDDVVVTPPAGGTGSVEGIAPVNGATIKLGLWQNGMGKFLYFNGEVANQYYLGTTEDFTAAVNLTVEQVTGGWHLWFMKDGVKTYVTIVPGSGTHVNAVMVTDIPAPFVWNTTYKTFTLNVNGEDYFIGTYTKSDGNDYDTLSASKLSYLSGDTNYPTHLYTEVPAKTGDISSVFVALLAVSAIGAGALISKKGKFVA